MKIKTRLHRAFSLLVLSILVVMGLAILALTQGNAARALDKELSQTSFLIYKIVKNVFDLNEKMLLGNLGIITSSVKSAALDRGRMMDSDAEHYLTSLTDYVRLPEMRINGRRAFGDAEFVDELGAMTGSSVSVLQLFPKGLLQIATTIRRPDGSRATEIYYPADHPVTKAIREGRTYVGKAFEMSEWYIVAYAPIYEDGQVIGAVQAGIKPDIADLRANILDITIGRTGHPYIVDTEGILVIAASGENENVYHLRQVKKMIEARSDGTVEYREGAEGPKPGEKVILHYRYLPEMDWIVATGSYEREFYGDQEIIKRIIILSVLVAFLLAVVASLQVAEALTRPINLLTENMNAVKELSYDLSDRAAVSAIKARLDRAPAKDEEIAAMTESFRTLLVELEDAQQELVSKHRRYREAELAKKAAAMLRPDIERLRGDESSLADRRGGNAAGSYFDSSPGPGGQTWYAIGDSRDRSASAGLVMMLAQATMSSMAKAMPDASSAEFAGIVNVQLVDRLRSQAKTDDFLAFSILVVEQDGACSYIGPHERILVCRAEGRCEILATSGPEALVSGVSGVSGVTSLSGLPRMRRLSARLGAGDILVLDAATGLKSAGGGGKAGQLEGRAEAEGAAGGGMDAAGIAATVAGCRGLGPEEILARVLGGERSKDRQRASAFVLKMN